MRREDYPTIAERVGSALSDGDLRQREGPCDLDKVGALGMVGVEEKLAATVFRLKYANQPTIYPEALEGVYGIARSLDARHRWRLKRWRLRLMARVVLDYWLSDICPGCNGVRYLVVPGTPHLSDRPCPECMGGGKRAMPWVKRAPRRPEGRRATHLKIERWKRVRGKLADKAYRHRQLLVELERAESRIGDKMVAKLAAQVRAI